MDNNWWDYMPDFEAYQRYDRALKADMTPMEFDREAQTARFGGSSAKKPYETTLQGCTCVDYGRRKAPCKHMYRLALELGLMEGEFKTDARCIIVPVDKEYLLEEIVEKIERLEESEQMILAEVVGCMSVNQPFVHVLDEYVEVCDSLVQHAILDGELGLYGINPKYERCFQKVRYYLLRKFRNDCYYYPILGLYIKCPAGSHITEHIDSETGEIKRFLEFRDDVVTELLSKNGCNRLLHPLPLEKFLADSDVHNEFSEYVSQKSAWENLQLGDVIRLPHTKYGSLEWTAINVTADTVTLWCQVLPDKMPFDVPSSTPKYLRIDHIGKGGGKLRDDVEKHVMENGKPKIIKDKDGKPILDKNGNVQYKVSQRYENLSTYGCNQWALCSLRKWLNDEFLAGLGADVITAIVPQVNTCLLSVGVSPERYAPIPKYMTSRKQFAYTDSVSVYEEYDIPKFIDDKKFKCAIHMRAIVTDSVYILPRSAFNCSADGFFKSPDDFILKSGDEEPFYWIMDANPASEARECTATLMAHIAGITGKEEASIEACNARIEKGVCPVVTLRLGKNLSATCM